MSELGKPNQPKYQHMNDRNKPEWWTDVKEEIKADVLADLKREAARKERLENGGDKPRLGDHL